MQFAPTPLNVSSLLVVCLGILAILVLSRRQYDSNLPILFYLVVVAFTSWTEREVSSVLYGSGLIMALLLRFEFLNRPLTKIVMVLEMGLLAAVNVVFLTQIFSL